QRRAAKELRHVTAVGDSSSRDLMQVFGSYSHGPNQALTRLRRGQRIRLGPPERLVLPVLVQIVRQFLLGHSVEHRIVELVTLRHLPPPCTCQFPPLCSASP